MTAEAIDPQIFEGAARWMKRAAAANVPNVRDDKVWAEITSGAPPKAKEPEPPPKPRHVVDVYHGDKHVQEIFQ